MSRKNKSQPAAARARPKTAAPAPAGRPTTPVICAALVVLTLVLFGQTFWFGFLDYDDNIFITENRHVQGGFTWGNIVWAFTNNDAYLWHPLTWFSHMLDFRLFGFKGGGHHFVTVLIHSANAVLVFLTLKRLTGARWRSALVAALFAWHPCHVESVAWISERKDVLSCFFWMLTIWTYCRYTDQPGFWRYATMLLSFMLGLMCKPMLVTLPCVLLLLDVWPLQRLRPDPDQPGWRAWLQWRDLWKIGREKIPMLIIVVLVSVLTVKMMASSAGLASTTALPLTTRAANALASYLRYATNVFWPSGLSIFYPFPKEFPVWLLGTATLVVGGVSVLALLHLRRRGWLATGWFWYLGSLVPAIGFVQNGNQSMADRYTYIPYIGLFIALVWGVAALVEFRPALARWFQVAAVAALLACGVVTTLQLRYWENTEILFGHSLQVTTDNFIAHTIYADALFARGKYEEAATHYQAALKITPGLVQAMNNLANVYLAQGRAGESAAYYLMALQRRPNFPEAHSGAALAFSQLGKPAEAIEHYEEALRLRPDYADAHIGLGTVYVNQGKTAEALAHYQEGLKAFPNSAEALAGVGMAMALRTNYAGAEPYLSRALKISDSPSTRNNLANVLVLLNRPAEAVPHFQAAMQLNPGWIPPMNSYARLRASAADPALRDGPTAVRLAEEMCRRAGGDQPALLLTLAMAYAEVGRFPEAMVAAQKAGGLAATAGQTELVGQIQTRLTYFMNGRAYHEGDPSPAP